MWLRDLQHSILDIWQCYEYTSAFFISGYSVSSGKFQGENGNCIRFYQIIFYNRVLTWLKKLLIKRAICWKSYFLKKLFTKNQALGNCLKFLTSLLYWTLMHQ